MFFSVMFTISPYRPFKRAADLLIYIDLASRIASNSFKYTSELNVNDKKLGYYCVHHILARPNDHPDRGSREQTTLVELDTKFD